MLTIDLEPEVEERLERLACSQGVDPTQYARRLIEEHLPEAGEDPLVALMQAWTAEDATEDPAELAARDREWEELKANLNANRAATGERQLFP